MKLLNTGTPVTRNFIPQILLIVQDFYFHKVGYTSYDQGMFGPETDLRSSSSRLSIILQFVLLFYRVGWRGGRKPCNSAVCNAQRREVRDS
jgi:hypothetical protein